MKPTVQDPVRPKLSPDQKTSADNMYKIGLAFHSWTANVDDRFPPAAICDKDGKPLLSWRVLILRAMGEEKLFGEFKLNEPWDGPNNKKLLDRMPAIYRTTGSEGKDQTHYRIFTGPNTLWDSKVGLVVPSDADPDEPGIPRPPDALPRGLKGTVCRFPVHKIPDKLSVTILVVESTESVLWTKPDELIYDAAKPIPSLGKVSPDRFLICMADGRVRWLNKKIAEKTLRSAIDPADRQPAVKDFDAVR